MPNPYTAPIMEARLALARDLKRTIPRLTISQLETLELDLATLSSDFYALRTACTDARIERSLAIAAVKVDPAND